MTPEAIAARIGRLSATLPLYRALRYRAIAVEAGRVVCAIEAGGAVVSPLGATAGGYIAAALDTTMAWAADSLAAPGRAHVTADLALRYLRPVPADGATLTVEGRVLRAGRRLVVVEGWLRGPDGAALAAASGGFLPVDVPEDTP